jgi:acetyl esterase/lipase
MNTTRVRSDAVLTRGGSVADSAGRPRLTGGQLTWLAVALILLALIGMLAATTAGRTAVRTLFFLPAMFPQAVVLPLGLISSAPVCEEVILRYADIEAPADLCAPPGGGPHGAIVLTLGVHPLDRYDPFLVQVTEALARTGLVVLRPVSPDLSAGIIALRDLDGLVAAFQMLQGRPEVDPARVGLAGFSVGGALSTVAAADPRIREHVRLVYTFGAYYDARDVLGAISDGRVRADGVDEVWMPHPWSVHVFAEQIVYGLPAGAERDYLAAALADAEAAGPPGFPLSSLGQMVYAMAIEGQRVDGSALLAALPPELRDTFYRLSPAAVVGNIRAPLYVMHDVGDTLIPYTESRRLVASLPAETPRRYDEFHMFQHVTPRAPEELLGSLGDFIALYQHLSAVFLALAR